MAESVFQHLGKETIRRRKIKPCEFARRDIFEYLELIYNPKRNNTNKDILSALTSKQDTSNFK